MGDRADTRTAEAPANGVDDDCVPLDADEPSPKASALAPATPSEFVHLVCRKGRTVAVKRELLVRASKVCAAALEEPGCDRVDMIHETDANSFAIKSRFDYRTVRVYSEYLEKFAFLDAKVAHTPTRTTNIRAELAKWPMLGSFMEALQTRPDILFDLLFLTNAIEDTRFLELCAAATACLLRLNGTSESGQLRLMNIKERSHEFCL